MRGATISVPIFGFLEAPTTVAGGSRARSATDPVVTTFALGYPRCVLGIRGTPALKTASIYITGPMNIVLSPTMAFIIAKGVIMARE